MLTLARLFPHRLFLAALWLAACADDPASPPGGGPSWPPELLGDGAVGAAPGDGAVAPAVGQDSGSGAPWSPHDGDAAVDGGAGDGSDGRGPEPGPGKLPPASDLKQPGPFTPTSTPGPAGYVLFHPQELGEGGVKHPIVVWGPGAVENAGMFTTLLNHLASHGFAVISYDATPQGPELTEALDWMIEENGRADSPFYQKLDAGKVAVGGHSAGSLATFRIGADARLTTTLHISGGTFDPHTDIENLHAPALFICGEPPVDGLLVGDVARPNCDIDFENASVPVFYGVTKGASHMTPTEIGDATLRSHQIAAMTGWLRWQLADEASLASMFAGGSCTLCSDPAWTVQQKGFN
jgi:hypothetical protein